MRTGPLSRKRKLRVDLHGVSVFGPGKDHCLIRWEWITGMRVDGGVVIESRNDRIVFPKGAFDLTPDELRRLLERARSIERRGEEIGRLAAGGA